MHAKKHETHMTNEERLAVLETTILNINSSLIDIRRQFDVMNEKFEHLENKFDKKIDALDAKFDKKIDALDAKFDKKFDALDAKFDRKFEILNNRIWTNFIWTVGIAIGLAGLVAHAQHWI